MCAPLLSCPAKRGRGTTLRSKVVEGASAMTSRAAQDGTQRAPSTALRAVPLPRFAGADKAKSPRSSMHKVRRRVASQPPFQRRRRRPALWAANEDLPERPHLQLGRHQRPAARQALCRLANAALMTPAIAARARAPQWQCLAIEPLDGGEGGFALHNFVLPHQLLVVGAARAPFLPSHRHDCLSGAVRHFRPAPRAAADTHSSLRAKAKQSSSEPPPWIASLRSQ
jgi:hypothetical protein